MRDSYGLKRNDLKVLVACMADMLAENLEKGLKGNPFNWHWFYITTTGLGTRIKSKVRTHDMRHASKRKPPLIRITFTEAEIAILSQINEYAQSKVNEGAPGALYITAICRTILENELKRIAKFYQNPPQYEETDPQEQSQSSGAALSIVNR